MGKILVTGASGHIGKLTLENLIARKVPADQLAALVRDPAKAQDLKALGIQLHKGDYMDPASLLEAFKDVEKLVLVPTHAFTDRKLAHANVVDVAVKSGVKHIVYMPIIRKEGSNFSMKEVTAEDIFTEDKIIASGIPYTFVKHPPFLNTFIPLLGQNLLANGIRVPSGNGKAAPATREDLAEAHGAVLTQPGHENKTYILAGAPAVSFSDMAEILSKLSGKQVPVVRISDEQYLQDAIAAGTPDFVAPFILEWIKGVNHGEWDNVTGDLERLIGHKPTSTEEYLKRLYMSGAWKE
jgi:NAD(P)H dehydrogenase (quinone)